MTTKYQIHRLEQKGAPRRRVHSHALAAFGYSPARGRHWFTFKSHKTGAPLSVYEGRLPGHVYATLCRVNSPGRFFNKVIRGTYLLERVY